MQTQTQPHRDDRMDETSKILAFVIGAFLLLAAIWALTSLFTNDRATVAEGTAVERTIAPETGTAATP